MKGIIKQKTMNEINIITIIAGTMIVLDYVYLNSFSKYFKKVFKEIQGQDMEVKLPSAAAVYVIMVFALYYFGFVVKLKDFEMALLGFVIYSVYEFTNHATINTWPLWMVAVDSIWGATLFFIVFKLTKKLIKN